MLISILKRFWREIIIAILIIAISISVTTCSNKTREIQAYKQSTDSTYKTITTFENKNKELVSQIKTHELTAKELKENSEALGIENKKLKNQVGNLNNLVGYWKVKAGIKDTITIANRDTVYIEKGIEVKGKWFEWNNNYLTLTGITTERTTSIAYDYKLNFSLTAYRKPHGLFGLGKSELLSDVIFEDKSIKVNEFKGIIIKEERKKFYQTKGFIFGAGIVLGTVGTIKLLK